MNDQAHPAATDGPELMRISDAARAAGVTRQTVEYYIMMGLIEPIRPEGSRRRFFDEALVHRIRLIRELNQSGYTLQAIRETYFRKDKK
jgi:MerR family copper efflux transcriptional regulator